MFNIFFPKNRAVNVEKYCTAGQATNDVIRRMRFACWMPKATDTHSEYVILNAFPQKHVTIMRTYIAGLVKYYLDKQYASKD
jgi:hypothetical protein